MATPIFVVGTNRSGTTWLGNMLCRHSEIAGIQAQEHEGIHESAYFSHVVDHFGNITEDNGFIEFVEVFTSSDYYRLTGLDKDFLYENRPKTYTECFRLIMDWFAEKKGAEYWVEKSPLHALYLDHIISNFPDAYVFGMHRNILKVFESTVKLWKAKKKSKHPNLVNKFKFLLLYVLVNKYIKIFANKYDRVNIIKFSELKKHPKLIAEKLTSEMGLSFEPALLQQQYAPNTSFSANKNDRQARKEVLSSLERRVIPRLKSLLDCLPYGFYRMLNNLWKYYGSKNLPKWFWKMYKNEVLRNF